MFVTCIAPNRPPTLLRLPGHCWGIGAIVLLGGQHAAGLRVIGGGGEVVVEVEELDNGSLKEYTAGH